MSASWRWRRNTAGCMCAGEPMAMIRRQIASRSSKPTAAISSYASQSAGIALGAAGASTARCYVNSAACARSSLHWCTLTSQPKRKPSLRSCSLASALVRHFGSIAHAFATGLRPKQRIDCARSRLAGAAFPIRGISWRPESTRRSLYRHVRDGRALLAQAPTGIGKTMGTLFPALRAMPRARLDKLFYLVAKTSGVSRSSGSFAPRPRTGRCSHGIRASSRPRSMVPRVGGSRLDDREPPPERPGLDWFDPSRRRITAWRRTPTR